MMPARRYRVGLYQMVDENGGRRLCAQAKQHRRNRLPERERRARIIEPPAERGGGRVAQPGQRDAGFVGDVRITEAVNQHGQKLSAPELAGRSHGLASDLDVRVVEERGQLSVEVRRQEGHELGGLQPRGPARVAALARHAIQNRTGSLGVLSLAGPAEQHERGRPDRRVRQVPSIGHLPQDVQVLVPDQIAQRFDPHVEDIVSEERGDCRRDRLVARGREDRERTLAHQG